MVEVIVALGGNLGNPHQTFLAALEEMKKLGSALRMSKWYKTAPVSVIPQADYLNAVAAFETDWDIKSLFAELESIESRLGKLKKPKESPRILDLDLLFYGNQAYRNGHLEVPHPRWSERLFVLVPLRDLFEEITVMGKRWNIQELIESLPKKEVKEVYDEVGSV